MVDEERAILRPYSEDAHEEKILDQFQNLFFALQWKLKVEVGKERMMQGKRRRELEKWDSCRIKQNKHKKKKNYLYNSSNIHLELQSPSSLGKVPSI